METKTKRHGTIVGFKMGCKCFPCLESGRIETVIQEPFELQDISEWRHLRKCEGRPASLFYATDLTSIQTAKLICATCPAETQCREWALAHGEHGVWGRTSDRDRRRIYRQRNLAKRLTRSTPQSTVTLVSE